MRFHSFVRVRWIILKAWKVYLKKFLLKLILLVWQESELTLQAQQSEQLMPMEHLWHFCPDLKKTQMRGNRS